MTDQDDKDLSIEEQVDRLAEMFEKAWHARGQPRIEDYLPKVSEPHRVRLLRELPTVELELRLAAGDEPQQSEYQRRFAHETYQQAVSELFAPKTLTAVGNGGSITREGSQHPVQIGDFRIERQLGAGGIGIVYLARQVSLGRLVALKVLGRSLDRESDKVRFRREAQAVAKLSHPNIAGVHFVGQDDRLCYMAMEYIEGVSLREAIECLGRTTEPGSGIDDYVSAREEAASPIERFDDSFGSGSYGVSSG